MKSKEEEFKEIFFAEAQENQQELDKLFTDLEKNHSSKKAIEAIFRITHTLKANAAGMGYEDVAGMAHTLEDVFSEIKHSRIVITTDLFNDLFRANDVLGAMITSLREPGGEKVKFRGIKTKLEVLLRNCRKSDQPETEASVADPIVAKVPETEAPEPLTLSPELPPVSDSGPVAQPGRKRNKEKVPPPAVAAEAEVMVLDAPEAEVVLSKADESSKISLSDNIHIPVRKLDELMNLVGELLIEKDRVISLSTEQGRKLNEFARLQRITSELQYSVMDVRLVQVAVLFNKFHRIVRDVATMEGKQVNLVLEGAENEIDRNVLQIISDSLIHLVRNAVSHGIETEQERMLVKKSPVGTVKLSARSEKEEVIIEVSDDGKGINPAVIGRKALEKGLVTPEMLRTMNEEDITQLIFEPGFSSAEKVTAVSGRGVGMDVVKKAIDAIGGKISIQSEVGRGSTIRLSLPSSMAVKNALLFELGSGSFAIPLSYTEAVISLYKRDIFRVGNGLLARYLDNNISIVFLNDLFRLESIKASLKEGILQQTYNTTPDTEKLYIVVVSYNNRLVGFVVDKLLQQKEIVEKPLGQFFEEVRFISGATILGNGNVCLVLDAPAIMSFLFKNTKVSR